MVKLQLEVAEVIMALVLYWVQNMVKAAINLFIRATTLVVAAVALVTTVVVVAAMAVTEITAAAAVAEEVLVILAELTLVY
jgi:hypothetical protein